MTQNEQLAEAKYIHRGDDGELLEHQCGFGCDYSYLVNRDSPGCYRMCKKLNIRVGDYDTCKYYDDKEYTALIAQFAKLSLGIEEPKTEFEANSEQSKNRSVILFIVIAVLVGVFLYWKFLM